MQNKRRLIIFSHTTEPRIHRFKQEAKKLGLTCTIVDFYNSIVSINGIYQNGEKLTFQHDDIFLGISNSMANHYITLLAENDGYFVWPSYHAASFSDKYYTNVFFKKHNIPTPQTTLITSFNIDHVNTCAQSVGGFPCVIKSNKGSMGKNVALVYSPTDIVDFIKNTMSATTHATVPFKRYSFQLQEFIKESSGTDYRVLCLNGEIIGGIKRTAMKGFKANISLGGTAEPFEINQKLKEICLTIMQEGNLFYGGIDFIKKGDDYLAIEINTSAQFCGFEKATNINVPRKILDALLLRSSRSL
jgi:RimK family alpha-L-glutamate ligase